MCITLKVDHTIPSTHLDVCEGLLVQPLLLQGLGAAAQCLAAAGGGLQGTAALLDRVLVPAQGCFGGGGAMNVVCSQHTIVSLPGHWPNNSTTMKGWTGTLGGGQGW
jgi:hypothetical protein